MDLLEKASIILTPTAYNNGEALCVKPSDGSGDFDFSRNSAATRVNAQGLVENVQILSSNLVQNGDFSEEGAEEVSNGSFSQEGVEQADDSVISNAGGSVMTKVSALNYNATSDGTGGSIVRPRLQFNNTTIGKSYRIRINPTNQSGTIDFKLYDGSQYIITGNDLTTDIDLYFKAEATNVFIAFDGTEVFNVDFEISLKEVGQDWNLGTNWSIGEDKAISDGTSGNLYQSGIIVTGKQYKIQVTVSDYVSGNVQVSAGAVPRGTMSANGTYTFYQTASSTSNLFLISNIFNGSITNISVKEVGQNWDLGTGFSIGEDKAFATNASNSNLQQTNITISNTKKYKINFTINDYTSGSVRPMLGAVGAVVGTFVSANGTYTEILTANNNFDRIVFRTSATAFNGSITNISVIEITDDTNLPRINYEGFSYQDALGSELVTNGDFDNTIPIGTIGSGWAKVVDGTNIVEYSNGGVKLTRATTSECKLYAATLGGNTNVLTSGKTYKLTYEVMSVNGSVTLRYFSGSGYVTVSSQVGIHTLTFEQGAATGLSVFYNTTDNTDITIDNVSVKEYLGQEVVPDSGCGSWLFEPQSTNLVPYSEDFSDASWVNSNSTDTSNYGISPDGLNNSTRFLTTANTGSFLYINSLPILDDTNYTLSFWVKSNGNSLDKFRLYTTTGGTSLEFTSTNKWVRYEYNFLSTGTTTNLGIRGVVSQETDIQIWGAQLEQQSYATSYIPTNGEANGVTRNQDVCTNGGSLASINSTEGTLYFEGSFSQNGRIALMNTSTSDQVVIGFSTSIFYRIKENNVNIITNFFSSANELNRVYKIAVKYQSGNCSIFVDGIKETDTNTFSLSSLSKIQFVSEGQELFGKTKALAVWKEALSDEELTELTTI